MEEPIIIDNDSWYTTKEVVQQEGNDRDTGSAMTLWSMRTVWKQAAR